MPIYTLLHSIAGLSERYTYSEIIDVLLFTAFPVTPATYLFSSLTSPLLQSPVVTLVHSLNARFSTPFHLQNQEPTLSPS